MALSPHGGEAGPDGVHRAEDAGFELVAELFVRGPLDRSENAVSGVADDGVEVSFRGEDFRHGAPAAVFVVHIQPDRDDARDGLFNGSAPGSGVDGHAGLGQQAGGSGSDAAAAAGQEDDTDRFIRFQHGSKLGQILE